MMPVIRISDYVMDILKQFAVPLEDNPDSVLRRILEDYINLKSQAKENPPMLEVHEPLTPAQRFTDARIKFPRPNVKRYAKWIIASLSHLGGRAAAEDVTRYIERVFGPEFTYEEKEDIASGEIRWHKRVHFARYDMARGGLLNEDAPRGIWELTEKGKNYYKD